MVIVVGGHSRNIGKTSVVCGVIRALPDWNWTAIKIKQYGHGICSRDGGACECPDPAHLVTVYVETGLTPSSDSGRFLAAGAARAFWVRTLADELNEAMPRIQQLLAESENAIIESNSILRFLQPDLCAMVLDGGVADFKPSTLRFLDRANVLVVTGGADLAWPQVSASLLRNKPLFAAPPPRYENEELIAGLKNFSLLADHTHR